MRILAEDTGWRGGQQEDPEKQWLTTGTVAQMFERTPRGVRWLAQERRLRGEHTRSGQWLFRPEEVQRVLRERAATRQCSRQERLRAVRVRMLTVDLEPRQLSLWRRGKGERSLPTAAVKGLTIVRKSA